MARSVKNSSPQIDLDTENDDAEQDEQDEEDKQDEEEEDEEEEGADDKDEKRQEMLPRQNESITTTRSRRPQACRVE